MPTTPWMKLLIIALMTSSSAIALAQPDSPVVRAMSPQSYVAAEQPVSLDAIPEASAPTEQPKIIGDFEPEAILDAVSVRQEAIGRCYEEALQRAPTLSGELVLQWEITPFGKVRKVAVVSDHLEDEEMVICVVAEIYALKFEKPESGEPVGVNFPLGFDPEG